MTTRFSALIQDIPGTYHQSGVDPLITGITLDSRRVEDGHVFVALSGTQVDGHTYIPDAVQRGAAAVITEKPYPELTVPCLETSDARAALASLSAAFYDFPARKLTMIGVT
ncbi:MAG: Mur ligase domain-containing protein, partial [Chloroflexota bacterium]